MSSSWIKALLLGLLFFLIGFGGIMFYTKKTVQKKTEERKAVLAKSAFSLENAPKATNRGDITSLIGDVTWTSRTATEPAKLIATTKIQEGEELHTGSTGKTTISFPEIGSLALLPETDVQIVQTYPASFVIGQTKGTVTYDKTGTGGFSIRSLHLLSRLDSGKADITVDDESDEITIFVHTGSVTVGFNDSDNFSTVKTISAGETFIYNDGTRDSTLE